jgi:hypothetical protein
MSKATRASEVLAGLKAVLVLFLLVLVVIIAFGGCVLQKLDREAIKRFQRDCWVRGGEVLWDIDREPACRVPAFPAPLPKVEKSA